MQSSNDVLVLGGAIHPFARYKDGSTPRDWAVAVISAALREAGVTSKDVMSVIVAVESDHMSLQLSPAALLADVGDLRGRSVMRVEAGGGSGASAVRAAYAEIMAGLADCVLVVGVEHAGSHLSSNDVGFLYGLSFDADFEGFLGLTPANLYALSISAHMERFGTCEADLAAVSVKNHGNACKNPCAHSPLPLTVDQVLESVPVSDPYKRLDCSPLSDGASAVVLARRGWAPKSCVPFVRIAGSGCANDWVHLGDRPDPDRFVAKSEAARQAYDQANVSEPSSEIDIVEVYDAFTGVEIQSLEDLGLAKRGRATRDLRDGRFDREGELPVNVSGGLLGQGGAPGATGVAQIVHLEQMLSGRSPLCEDWSRAPRRALADAHGGVGTIAITHILERD